MDLERSLKYPFNDQEWLQKILIGGMLSVVPIINLATWGYALRALKNITQGEEVPLPEWSEFGDYFVKGLMSLIATLVYSIPIILLACVGSVLGNTMMSAAQHQPHMVSYPRAMMGLCIGFLATIYGLLMAVVLPAAFTKYAITAEFADFFRFGEIFSYIGSNPGNYFIALVVTVILYAIPVPILTGLAAPFSVCLIGLVLIGAIALVASLITAHLFAQVYIESKS